MGEQLKQAEESLFKAELLCGERMGNKAVLSDLYHAIMYALFTLLNIRDIERLTHANVIEGFDREYVRKGLFDGSLLDSIHRAYDMIHDYDHAPVPTDDEIKQIMSAARDLIRKAEYCQGHTS